MIKKLGRQLIVSLTIMAMISSSLALAAPVLPSLTPPASSQKTPAQRLAESRKDDRRQCEAEVQSGTPSFGQALVDPLFKPLKDAIKEETGKVIPQGVNDALANRIPAGIEQGIKKELPDIVTEGLKRELPLTLGEQIKAEMARNDSTFQEVVRSDRFTGLVRASIDESLPRIIQDGLHDRLPNIIDESIRVEIPNALRLQFNKVAKPTIENHFRAQIDSLITKIPQMVVDEVKNLQATIEGTISGVKAAMQSLAQGSPLDMAFNAFALVSTFLTTGDWDAALNSIPEIAQMRAMIENLGAQVVATKDFIDWANELITNKDLLVQNLVDGFAVELSQSLTNPKNIARLADSIGSAMTDPINRSLANATERIEASIEGPINDAINGVNGLPDRFFAPIDAALNDISGLVNLEIEMVVHAVTNPIISTIDVVSKNLATEIDRGLEGVLGPIVGGAGNFLGNVGNDLAFQMRAGAMQTHINIFGSEGLFVEEPGGQPLWPNGVTDLPEPPTYFPVPGEDGSMGPFLPAPPVGPSAPGEAFAPESQLGPITEATEELSTSAADATIASTETVVGEAFAKTTSFDALASGAASLVPGAISAMSGVLTGLLKTGNPLADAAIAVVVNKAMAAASAAVFGAAGAVIAVPVTEIGALLAVNQSTDSTTSKILQTSEQIKTMTEKIYSLQVQSCTYLKIAQRVQLALEEKELLNDPNVRKANAEALYRTQLEFVNNFINQGREISDGMTRVTTDGTGNNKGSLIVGNYSEFVAQAGQEAGDVFTQQVGDLAQDTENYPNLNAVHQSLVAQNSQDPLRGTLTKTEIDTFRDNPQSLSNADYWKTFRELGDPKNNVYGQTLIAQGLRDQAVAKAQSAAAAEYTAGQGYSGTRECPPENQVQTPNGMMCSGWRTLTPGSTIGGFNDRLAQVALEQAAASDELIEDSTKSEVALSAKRVANLSNLSETVPSFSDVAEQSVFNQSDPCPGPGPCSQTGWPRQTSRPTLPTLPALPVTPPALTAAFGIKQMPTLTDLAVPGVKNETIISWQSSNATACYAKNDWDTGRVGNTVRTAGMSLETKGEVTITHPITFQASFSRTYSITGLVGLIPTKIEPASDLLKDKLIFNPILASSIHPDDVFRLTVQTTTGPLTLDVGGSGTVNPPTPLQVLELFNDAITNAQETDTPLGNELRKYNFAYITTDPAAGKGYMIMSPKLTYELTCTKGEQSVEKFITLTRKQ